MAVSENGSHFYWKSRGMLFYLQGWIISGKDWENNICFGKMKGHVERGGNHCGC